MKFNLKSFDIHTKTLEGVTQKTGAGAVLTLVSAIVVLVLLLTEVRVYSSRNIVSRMQADNKVGIADESMRIYFDIEFFEVPCNKISFKQEVTKGTMHLHSENQPGDIKKEMYVHPNKEGVFGCWVYGSIVTDRVGGNFVFNVDVEKKSAGGPGPGQQNLPPEILSRLMIQSPPKVPNLDHHIKNLMILPIGDGSVLDPVSAGELSNNIIQIIESAGEKNEMNSLGGVHKTLPEDTGLHHYNLQVIPTQYQPLKGEYYKQNLNQYNVNERSVESMFVNEGNVQLAGQSFMNTYGLVFTYDFYPILLILEETREPFIDFIANLFGIVGGVITVIGMLGGCFHEAKKAIIGKKD